MAASQRAHVGVSCVSWPADLARGGQQHRGTEPRLCRYRGLRPPSPRIACCEGAAVYKTAVGNGISLSSARKSPAAAKLRGRAVSEIVCFSPHSAKELSMYGVTEVALSKNSSHQTRRRKAVWDERLLNRLWRRQQTSQCQTVGRGIAFS